MIGYEILTTIKITKIIKDWDFIICIQNQNDGHLENEQKIKHIDLIQEN